MIKNDFYELLRALHKTAGERKREGVGVEVDMDAFIS